MINDQGKSRQIDHIAITEYGVYVIETKNYSGTIYGKETWTNWYSYLRGKKYEFTNPIHQNYGHTKIVKKIIYDEKIYVEPVVVFIDKCKVKVYTQSKVTYASMVVNYIQSKPKQLSIEKIDEIYNEIMENRITNEEIIHEHEDNVRLYKEYKEKIANSGICPRCGAKLVEKQGKYGKFYGCSSYPKCRYVKNI